ncbi:DUF4148 domain-containing protein [Diaphorobacter sp. HDW4A]|uniref:DUF4148 domain-containing protein n=1 Tax=Diaphorobacter sp. HDW4A TaxID=2714924 RepID=UPI00140B1EBD|nr:DUF4148 domain-containing protein [Diaphorobacter sp. HDW4A]QIL83477.1 DUF4148 domain-containing protein [Diaphorobacter sp. HDW4A]
MKNILNTAAVVAVIAMGAVSAQAQVQSAEAGYATDVVNAQSTLSRQQVSNTFLAARKDGSLPLAGGDSYADPVKDARGSSLARGDVQRQAGAAAQAGNALRGEGSVQ